VASTDTTALQRSDLNQFLFAEIGMEANGMNLSVLSAFARGGSDPWSEANRLAILPRSDAIDSLATMIANMPRSVWKLPDAGAIAARLVGLLPARTAGIKMATPILSPRQWAPNQIALVGACAALIIAFAVMILR
jgi:hypothetical protein